MLAYCGIKELERRYSVQLVHQFESQAAFILKTAE